MSDDAIRPEDEHDRPSRRRDEGYSDDDPPRRRRYDEEPKRSSNLWVWLLVGGGVLVLGCCVSTPLLLLPAVQKVRGAAARMTSQNNLKQIGLAAHNHASVYNDHLPEDIKDKNGKPLLSWRVAILPFIEQDNLYKQFRLDEPWDGPNNKRLLSQMPRTYLMPSRQSPDDLSQGLTYYQGFAGPRAVFDPKRAKPLRVNEIPDGTPNTLLVVEAPDAVPWTKPADIPYDPDGPVPQLRGHASGVCNVLFCDGSTRAVRPRAAPDFDRKLRLAIQIDDGGIADLD